MPVVEAYDLYRFYHAGEEETLALRGVSLRAEAGEIVALMGPSGSGKSSLLACLGGLDEPDGGFVMIAGRRLTRRPEPERTAIRAATIGVVMQSGNLFEHLTIEENFALQMRLSGLPKNPRRCDELLNAVGLGGYGRAYPTSLSGGEATRAGVAVALSSSPKVLLADEPTGEVDAETEARIIDVFRQYRDAGGALILATHSEEFASNADRVIVLADGRIVDG